MALLSDLGQDLRHGLRGLRGSPGFTALVVLSLGVGIAANAAIFSVINFVFLRPLPVPDPQGLVLFSDTYQAGNSDTLGSGPIKLYPYPLFQRLRDDNQAFEALAAQQSGHTTAAVRWDGSGDGGGTDLASGRAVTANYFGVLGLPAFRGRTFLPEDETAPGTNPVLVLSHRYWQRRFQANPAVIGSEVTVGKTRYTIVGVAAPEFVGTRVGVEVTDFWVPMTMQAALMGGQPVLADPTYHWLMIAGRLRPGLSRADAQARANAILQAFLRERPELVRSPAGPGAIRVALAPGGRGVSPLRQPAIRAPLLTVMAGVALLLLIVCLNVSQLLLARAISRRREMSIRTALGATRGRLTRQLLGEGLLLSLLGGAAATVITGWLVDALLSMIPAGLPLVLDVRVDARVLWFTAGLALSTALLVGVVPAWSAARPDLQRALQGSSHTVAEGGSPRLLGRLLMSAQVALSLVLLMSAGLLATSLGNLRKVAKGFDEQALLLVEMNPGLSGLALDQTPALYDSLLEKVMALPGVRSASLSEVELLSGSHSRGVVSVEGVSKEVEQGTVTPGYFQTLGMTLLRGRGFTRQDGPGTPAVAVVNQAFVQRLLGGGDPLGRRLTFGPASADRATLEVIGVVSDVKNDGLWAPARPMVYRPVAQDRHFLGSLQVRAVSDAESLAEPVRRAVREAHPGLPVTGVRTMRSQVERALTGERALATLAGAFGLVALFLVCVGLYGVISQWAARRTREIGVRVALGASTSGVRWLVMRHAFGFVLAGVVLGAPAALAVGRLLRGFIFGLHPMNPTALALATAAMFGVAALAAYLPARRASRADPMMALRSE